MIHPLAKYTTIITFLMALLICLAYVITGDMQYGFVGLYFFFGAGIINLIIMIFLAVIGGKGSVYLLLNIPTAIVFFAIGIYFTSIMRVTLINHTGGNIRNIKITGCESEQLELLENGDSETIWIDIKHDCQMEMAYTTAKGHRKSEVIMGYVTNGMGHKYEHYIGKSEYYNLNF